MATGTIKLQCVSCKKKREIPLEEARGQIDQPCCEKCGMPEVVISISVANVNPSRASHQS